MKIFSTKSACVDYISKNNLNAVPVALYSEDDDGEFLGWYVFYID